MKVLLLWILLLQSVLHYESCALEVFEFVVGHNDRYSDTQIIYQPYTFSLNYQVSFFAVAIWKIDSSDNACINPKLSVSTVNFYSNYTVFVNNDIIGSCANGLSATTMELRNCSDVSKYRLSPSIVSNNKNFTISFFIEPETELFYWYRNLCVYINFIWEPWCPVVLVYDFFAAMTIDCDTPNTTNTHHNNTPIPLGCCKLRVFCFCLKFVGSGCCFV